MKTMGFYLLLMTVTYNCSIAQTNDYYPLAVGNYWVYKSEPNKNSDYEPRSYKTFIESTDTVNGNECYTINSNIKKGSVRWTGFDKSGNVTIYAIGTKKFIFKEWNPPFILIPNNVSQGLTWENKDAGHSDAYPDSVFYAAFSCRIESTNETVTVPAGTFDNCLKILQTFRQPGGDYPSVDISYYAKGVGRVMSVNKDIRTELIEYFVGGNK
ncbi:MAG: hypothetical protein HOC71_17880 [Candidatus Latescibacteria bacterium]|jgi:hypothetical protein|nr:hypothetical protein [Candidatus Latescibacterota bacterium]